ncbi:hypothetical protein MC885_003733 [Smutsia gigantea]|nr:hypothetical protein MC885_003733 [Smutsia gigantea]
MFLMNAPPVVALQSKWEAFGPPGSFRFPGCFSESKEGVSRASVSAKVQMVISRLQSDKAALGMSNDCALQRSQRADRACDAAVSACGPAADFDTPGDEEAAGFRPLVLDSDSDDSVDRDIEEAIQEYLKAKSGSAQPAGATGRDSRCRLGAPQSSAVSSLCPLRPAPSSRAVPGRHTGAAEHKGSTSPVSVSSDDSLDQSIRAEIEQFLNKKRQQETPAYEVSADREPDPSNNSAKSALRSSKEAIIKAHRQDLPGPCKEFIFRKPPRLVKANTQPRGLRSKVATEPKSLGSTKPASTCRPAEVAQNKGGIKRNIGPGRRAKRDKSVALGCKASDSSSDDGIEEAIQLYQLEKRREASGDPAQKTPPGDRGPDSPAHSTSHSTKSAWPEAHGKTPSKKKPVAMRAVDLGLGGLDPDHPSKPPKETKASAPPGNAAAKSEPVERASCQAEPSAELMCAEAILDISKAILPAPREGSDRPLSPGPLCYPANVPSRSDSDSSSVDSDDSIEQEIRTFLALKAQSGSLLSRTETCLQSAQSPQLSPDPNSPASGLKAPVSKTLDLSLSCRRKRSGGGHPVQLSTPKKTRQVAKEGGRDADHSQANVQPGQGKASEASTREGEIRGQPLPCRMARLGDELSVPDTRDGVSPGPGKVAGSRSIDESSDDKSSSLDSDEDLDTAIKDLLRSKRQLRRCQEPRAVCRKKVRFSTTETQFLDKPGGLQKDWKDRGPHLLKSCLSKSKKDSRENTVKKPLSTVCREVEKAKPDSRPQAVPPALCPWSKALEGSLLPRELDAHGLKGIAPSPRSPSEDSSSVDSDDSIELEIRKFLAEKAKESVNSSEIPGGCPTTLGAGSIPRKMPSPALALQPGVCTRSLRGRGSAQLPGEGPRAAGRALVPGGGPGKDNPRVEQACVPAALARWELAPPRSGTASARGSPVGRRSVCTPKDQSPRRAEPAAGEHALGLRPSCTHAGTLPVNAQGQSPQTRILGADRQGTPQAGLALPWADFAHQGWLQSPWALNADSGDVGWKGGLSSEREKRPEEGQARCSPGLATDSKKGLPSAGFSSLLSTQLFHFGKSVSWGGKQAGLFSAPLSLPLQGPSFAAFRESPAGHGPVFGSSHLLTKEGGHWPGQKLQAAHSLHNRGRPGPEGSILDLRYRPRAVDKDEQDQEALGSGASELSDTSVEEGGSSPSAKGRALKL